MTSDEIRKRARNVLIEITENDGDERDLIQFAEEILGKPLEPEFDESKVKHGSVWKNSSGTTTLVLGSVHDLDLEVVVLRHENRGQTDGLIGEWRRAAESVTSCLRRSSYKYIGQYNFSSGIPKGGSK